MVVQQHVMAGRMVFRKIDTPLEHIGVHGSGRALMLSGDNLHPVAPAESVGGRHTLEGISLPVNLDSYLRIVQCIEFAPENASTPGASPAVLSIMEEPPQLSCKAGLCWWSSSSLQHPA